MKALFISEEGGLKLIEPEPSQDQLAAVDNSEGEIIRWNGDKECYERAIVIGEETDEEDEGLEPEINYDIAGWSVIQ